MKVRVRVPYFGKEGQTKRGDELEMSEDRFRQLTEGIHAGNPLVDPVDVGYKMEPRVKNKAETAPQNKTITTPTRAPRRVNLDGTEVAKGATADPTSTPPTGGPTGAASAASSSVPAPRPAKRQYTKRAVAPASSASTAPGSSRRGATFFTPVTSRGGKNTKGRRGSKV